MSNRAALFRQREGKRVLELAKKAGAKAVEFRYGEVIAIVRLTESDEAPVDPNEWDGAGE
jgi:hypothetical protein